MGAPSMKMIILDRDGVINHDSPDFIKSPAEWVPIALSLFFSTFAGMAVTVLVLRLMTKQPAGAAQP